MATWLFEFDLGSGYVDKTSLVVPETVDRFLEVHKDLKPTTNEINFMVGPDVSFQNTILAGGADIPMRVTKDGVRFFTGYVQRTSESSVRGNLGKLSLKAYDPSILLKRNLSSPYKKWSSTVSVIVGELLTAAGITSQNLGTISKAIDSATFDVDVTYWDAIEALLSPFGYVLYFDETGTARTFLCFPSSATSTATFSTGSAGNILDELKTSRKAARYGGSRVTFYRHDTRTNLVVFSDPTGAGQLNKCNIDLTQYSGVYPPRSGTEDVYCEYKVVENQVEREIIATNSVTFQILGSGIAVAQSVDYGLKAAIKVTGSGIITKLDVTAGSAILKGAKVVKESKVTGLTDDLDDYESGFITADADADFLVSGRRAYWQNSGANFTFKTSDPVTLGSVVTLVDGVLGYNLVALVAGFNEDDLGFKRVRCEALVAYSAQGVTTTGTQLPAPQPPNGIPIVQVADVTAPTVPTGLSVSQLSTGALRVGFSASTDTESGVALYRVYRRENGSSAEAVVMDVNGAGAGPFTADDTSPVKGKSYQYAVSAVDARGNESAKTSWSTATQSVVSDAPTGVSGLVAAATAAAVALNWTANSDAIAYRLEKSIDGGSTWLSAGGWPLTVNTNSYTEPLAAGTEPGVLSAWRYRVKGISKDGVLSSSYSSLATPSVGTWTWVPAAPGMSAAIAKRTAQITIAPQATLVDPDGWDVQISRDGTNWYCPNLAAASDADGWYSGALNAVLTVYVASFTIDYLPISLSGGLPLAAGESYRFRARARGKNNGVGSWTASGALTAFPGLYADLAAQQIKEASVADNAVTMTKLTIRDPENLADNPGLEAGNTGWLSLYGVAAGARTGSNCGQGATAPGAAYAMRNKNDVPCAAGDEFYIEAWITTGGTQSGHVRMAFYNAAGAEIAIPAGNAVSGSGWQLSSASVVAPANTVRGRVEIVGLAGSGTLYFDDVVLRRKNTATLIVDGAIITSKLAAGAVTAGKIGVTNLDVDGSANIIRLNAELVYSAATALVASGTGTVLLSSGPASGKYAYNYFDLTAGKFRVGDATNYLYYDGAGGLELRLTTFKVTSLATSVKGSLSLSDAGTLEALTKPLTISADGAGAATFKINGVTALTLAESLVVTIPGPILSTTYNKGTFIASWQTSNYWGFGSVSGQVIRMGGYNGVGTATSERTSLSINGDLGLGGTTPTAAGGATSDASMLLINSDRGSVANSALDAYYGTRTGSLGEVALLAHRNSLWAQIWASGAGGSLTYSLAIDGTMPSYMQGNLALGTSDASGYKLRVNGTLRVEGAVSFASTLTVASDITGGFKINNRILITSGTTWTSTFTGFALICQVGGGGAGGGASAGSFSGITHASGGGGGGGAGRVVWAVQYVLNGGVYSVTIGAAGVASAGAAGGSGGTTQFGNQAPASGGTGGSAGVASNGTTRASTGGTGGSGGGGGASNARNNAATQGGSGAAGGGALGGSGTTLPQAAGGAGNNTNGCGSGGGGGTSTLTGNASSGAMNGQGAGRTEGYTGSGQGGYCSDSAVDPMMGCGGGGAAGFGGEGYSQAGSGANGIFSASGPAVIGGSGGSGWGAGGGGACGMSVTSTGVPYFSAGGNGNGGCIFIYPLKN